MMVAFGKNLKERQIEEWKGYDHYTQIEKEIRGYYIYYKLMKKKVRQYTRQIEVGVHNRKHVLKDFSKMLDDQSEKVVLFLLKQQGVLASRLAKLDIRNDALQREPLAISLFSELKKLTELWGEIS